ncbi:MAG: hypothetical protein K2O42_02990 [Oscillospiraceae bacterium]|nr:hypothetical protein [Oscillospiraceae bacterium]
MNKLQKQDHTNKVRNTRSTDTSEENIRYWIKRLKKLSDAELHLMTEHGNTALALAAAEMIRERTSGKENLI